MKKSCLFLILILFFCISVVNAKTYDVFSKGWELEEQYYSTDYIDFIVLGSSSFSYNSGFVISNVDMELFQKEGKLSSTLAIYDLFGNVKKSIIVDDVMILSLTTNDSDIFAITMEETATQFMLVKYNSNLEKVNEVSIEVDEMFLELVFISKELGINIFNYNSEKIFVLVEEDTFYMYDKALNKIKDHRLTSGDDEFCDVYDYLCFMLFSSVDGTIFWGYDEVDNLKVVSGTENGASFIKMYDGETEIFDKTFDYFFTIASTTIVNDYILGLAVSDNGYHILMFDFDGNIVHEISAETMLNFTFNRKSNSIVFFNNVSSISSCPSYIEGDSCSKFQFEFYYPEYKMIGSMYSGENVSLFTSIKLLEDNEQIVVGATYASKFEGIVNKGGSDAVILKQDNSGELIWAKTFGGSSSDVFNDVVVTKNGDFIGVGLTNSNDIDAFNNKGRADGIIIKYDKDGNILWQKDWGGNGYDEFFKIYDVGDGYIITAQCNSTDIDGLDKSTVFLKIDEEGNILWQKSWNGDSFVSGSSVTSDNGLLLYSNGVIYKYDYDGNLLWENSYSVENTAVWFIDAVEMDDGSLVFLSVHFPNNSNPMAGTLVLQQFDNKGNLIKDIFKGVGSTDTFDSLEIRKTKNGRIVVILPFFDTSYYSELRIYDQDLTLISSKEYRSHIIFDLIYDNENSFIITGLEGIYLGGYIWRYEKQYLVDVEESENGSYEFTQEGDKGVVALTPERGYTLDTLSITNSKGERIKYYEENGMYYFDLEDGISINVTYKEEIINPNTKTFLGIGFILVVILTIYNLFIGRRINMKKYM